MKISFPNKYILFFVIIFPKFLLGRGKRRRESRHSKDETVICGKKFQRALKNLLIDTYKCQDSLSKFLNSFLNELRLCNCSNPDDNRDEEASFYIPDESQIILEKMFSIFELDKRDLYSTNETKKRYKNTIKFFKDIQDDFEDKNKKFNRKFFDWYMIELGDYIRQKLDNNLGLIRKFRTKVRRGKTFKDPRQIIDDILSNTELKELYFSFRDKISAKIIKYLDYNGPIFARNQKHGEYDLKINKILLNQLQSTLKTFIIFLSSIDNEIFSLTDVSDQSSSEGSQSPNNLSRKDSTSSNVSSSSEPYFNPVKSKDRRKSKINNTQRVRIEIHSPYDNTSEEEAKNSNINEKNQPVHKNKHGYRKKRNKENRETSFFSENGESLSEKEANDTEKIETVNYEKEKDQKFSKISRSHIINSIKDFSNDELYETLLVVENIRRSSFDSKMDSLKVNDSSNSKRRFSDDIDDINKKQNRSKSLF